jgi:hypothetical protein
LEEKASTTALLGTAPQKQQRDSQQQQAVVLLKVGSTACKSKEGQGAEVRREVLKTALPGTSTQKRAAMRH